MFAVVTWPCMTTGARSAYPTIYATANEAVDWVARDGEIQLMTRMGFELACRLSAAGFLNAETKIKVTNIVRHTLDLDLKIAKNCVWAALELSQRQVEAVLQKDRGAYPLVLFC
jgi:hypothetical protein